MDHCARAGEPHLAVKRLTVVCGFAAYLTTVDEDTEVPSKGLLPRPASRTTSYLFSSAEITALMAAAQRLRHTAEPRQRLYHFRRPARRLRDRDTARSAPAPPLRPSAQLRSRHADRLARDPPGMISGVIPMAICTRSRPASSCAASRSRS